MGLSSSNETKGKDVLYERQPMVILCGMKLFIKHILVVFKFKSQPILEGLDWHRMRELYNYVKYSKIRKCDALNALQKIEQWFLRVIYLI